MGQKVHPTGFRLGVIKKHNALWYAKGKSYRENLIEDLKVRNHISEKLRFAVAEPKKQLVDKSQSQNQADLFLEDDSLELGTRVGVEESNKVKKGKKKKDQKRTRMKDIDLMTRTLLVVGTRNSK